jgi:Asp-tRNA(Asn)/Glu-tRNA(Gln) amidotransferase B subunit
MLENGEQIRRYIKCKFDGITISRETLGFDISRGVTVPLRTKEDEVDYR